MPSAPLPPTCSTPYPPAVRVCPTPHQVCRQRVLCFPRSTYSHALQSKVLLDLRHSASFSTAPSPAPSSILPLPSVPISQAAVLSRSAHCTMSDRHGTPQLPRNRTSDPNPAPWPTILFPPGRPRPCVPLPTPPQQQAQSPITPTCSQHYAAKSGPTAAALAPKRLTSRLRMSEALKTVNIVGMEEPNIVGV